MTIGNRIQKLRITNGLSQNQLAKIAGISRQAVSKWENDQSSPDTIHLITLADILGTDVEYLATGKYTERVLSDNGIYSHSVSGGQSTSNLIVSTKNYPPSPLLTLLISLLSFLLGIIFTLIILIFS